MDEKQLEAAVEYFYNVLKVIEPNTLVRNLEPRPIHRADHCQIEMCNLHVEGTRHVGFVVRHGTVWGDAVYGEHPWSREQVGDAIRQAYAYFLPKLVKHLGEAISKSGIHV